MQYSPTKPDWYGRDIGESKLSTDKFQLRREVQIWIEVKNLS